MVLIPELSSFDSIWVRRRKKLDGISGFESGRNYGFETDENRPLALAATREKKHRGKFLLKLLFASWRPFEAALFDDMNTLVLHAVHPFRFYFQTFEIRYPDGRLFGRIERQFGLLTKRFDVIDAKETLIYSTSCPIRGAWSFSFLRNGKEQAVIHRRWSKEVKEKITKADRFLIEFKDPNMPHDYRVLVLMAALFVELMFVRRKGKKRRPAK